MYTVQVITSLLKCTSKPAYLSVHRTPVRHPPCCVTVLVTVDGGQLLEEPAVARDGLAHDPPHCVDGQPVHDLLVLQVDVRLHVDCLEAEQCQPFLECLLVVAPR